MKKITLRIGIIALFSIFTFGSLTPTAKAAADCTDLSSLPAADATCTASLGEDTCKMLTCYFGNMSTSDGPWYDQSPTQFANKVLNSPDDEIFGERYTYAQINWIMNSISTMLNPAAGVSNVTDLINLLGQIKTALDTFGLTSSLNTKEMAKLGPAGLLVSGIVGIYEQPPASAVKEVAHLAERLDFATPAMAQGYGFTGLQAGGAVLGLWTATRNMSYLVIIIFLIASGFLIMFRVKINPQTVVSIQTVIPKLILTLILITFSFAIAGLVIDMVYVIIAAFVGLLGINNLITNVPGSINTLANTSFYRYVILQAPGSILIAILSLFILLPLLTIFFGIGGVLVSLGVAAVGIWAIIILFKIFFMLMKAYVMIILQIITAPLQIMLDLVPGQQGFGPWLRNLIANASVFVTVPILLILQHIMSGNAVSDFVAKLTGGELFINQTFMGMGGGTIRLPFISLTSNNGGNTGITGLMVSIFTGFTIFALTPKIADMIRDALKIPAFKYGSAVNDAVGNIKSTALGALSPVRSRFEVQSAIEQDRGKAATTAAGKQAAYSRAQAYQQAASVMKPK